MADKHTPPPPSSPSPPNDNSDDFDHYYGGAPPNSGGPPPVDSTIGGNSEIPSFTSEEEFGNNFTDRDFEIRENIASAEEFEGKVSIVQADLIENVDMNINYDVGVDDYDYDALEQFEYNDYDEDLVPDMTGLKKCLCLILIYMALTIGLWTFQVSLMLHEGIAIMLLIVGTILLLIPCVIYWLRYLNNLLAEDEDCEDDNKSQSDVVSAADVQGMQMVDRNLHAHPDSHVVEIFNNNHHGEGVSNNQDQYNNDGTNPQFLEEGRRVRVNKVSLPSTSYEMPRISVAGDLLPPPLDYTKDHEFPKFMIGIPKYLRGTVVERDLNNSIESATLDHGAC